MNKTDIKRFANGMNKDIKTFSWLENHGSNAVRRINNHAGRRGYQ